MATKQKVKCKCGTTYSVSTEHAGRKANCKKCNQSFVIPGPQPVAALATPVSSAAALLNPYGATPAPSQESNTSRTNDCPSCGRALGSKVVCVYCGYHTGLGRKMEFESDEISKETETPIKGMEIGDVLPGVTGLLVGLCSLAVIVLTFFVNSQLEGPAFLAFYFGMFLVFGMLTLLGRLFLVDHDIFNDAAIFGLIGMGLARIFYSVANERFKFLILIFGMAISFAVFFISKTRNRQTDDSPFVSETGGMKPGPFIVLFAAGAIVLGIVSFVPPIRNLVAQVFIVFAVGLALAIAKGISVVTGANFMTGSPGHGGYYHNNYSSCSSCSSSSCSSCGGGGCGGGCGGCGG